MKNNILTSGINNMLEIAFDDNEKKDDPEMIKKNSRLAPIDDIVTPNKLDKEAEDILGSLENDVMKILRKTKYFDKVLEE